MAAFADWLAKVVGDTLKWIKDYFVWLWNKIWNGLLDTIANLLESLAVPSWVTEASAVVSALPPEVIWLLDPFEIGTGLAIIGSAYILRWQMKWIPFLR